MRKTKTSIEESHVLVEAAGWAGVVLILIAYAATSLKMLLPDSLTYQLLNIIGAVLLVFHAIKRKDKEVAILNLVWALVAAIAIYKLLVL